MTIATEKMPDSLQCRYEYGISFNSDNRVLILVAEPVSESLWAGGIMLMYPNWSCKVVSLGPGDQEKRRRFFNAMKRFGGNGSIGKLAGNLEGSELHDLQIQDHIRAELVDTNFDLVITHSPFGDYTHNPSNRAVGLAMLHLWHAGQLTTKELWMFAYSKSVNPGHPKVHDTADLTIMLPESIWEKKLSIIKETYECHCDSLEEMLVPRKEAFWRFCHPDGAIDWQIHHRIQE